MFLIRAWGVQFSKCSTSMSDSTVAKKDDVGEDSLSNTETRTSEQDCH